MMYQEFINGIEHCLLSIYEVLPLPNEDVLLILECARGADSPTDNVMVITRRVKIVKIP